MSFCRLRFNLYLLAAVTMLAASGCAGSLFHHKKEPVAVLRVHLESENSTAGTSKDVPVLRSHPVTVNIATDPLLTEDDLIAARLLDTVGGFAIELRFEETAGWRLEQMTATNPGKHLVIYGHWGEKPEDGRWLAAPLVIRRNATSTLTFTPDASREETDQFVRELQTAILKNAGKKAKE